MTVARRPGAVATLQEWAAAQPLAAWSAGLLAAAGVVLLITQVAVTNGTPAAVIYQGVTEGLAGSLVAVAIVLIYRATRVINFAQLAIGGVGAQLAFQLIRYERAIPFPVDLVLAVALAAATGAAFDLLMRRFSRAPRLLLTVFTVLLSYFLGGVLSQAILRLPFLPPLGNRPLSQLLGVNSLGPYLPFSGLSYRIGHLPTRFGFGHLATIEISVLLLVGLGAFLRFSRLGTAVRATAENTERSALLGISVVGLTTLVWAVAGGLSGASSLAQGMIGNPGTAYAFDPVSLLPALAAAALGRFRSIGVTVAASVAIAVLTDSVSFAMSDSGTVVTVGLLVVVLGGLALQMRDSYRLERAAVSWRLVAEARPIPKELSGLAVVRGARYLLGAVIVAGVALYPVLVNTRLISIGTEIALFGIVALSLVVLTGWTGQVSLGQYGLVAIGAVVAGGLADHAGVPFWFAVPIAAVITGVVAGLLGLPALRVPGLYLGIATFAFAVAVSRALFDPKLFGWLLPGPLARPSLFFLNFDDERSMYYLCLAALILTVVFVLNLRRTRLGRLLIALRENETDVAAMGVRVVRMKLAAFALSGIMAGFGGALLAFQLRTVPQTTFGADQSFVIFIYTLLGGATSVAGGLIGASSYELIQYFLSGGANPVLLYIAQTLPLALLYLAPSGLIAILVSLRDAFLRIVAQRRQLVVPSLFADQDPDALKKRLVPLAPPLTSGGLGALPGQERYRLPSRVLGTEADGSGNQDADSTAAARAAVGLGEVRR